MFSLDLLVGHTKKRWQQLRLLSVPKHSLHFRSGYFQYERGTIMARAPKVNYFPQTAGASATNWLRTLSFLAFLGAYYILCSDHSLVALAHQPKLLLEQSERQQSASGLFIIMVIGYMWWLSDQHSITLAKGDSMPFAVGIVVAIVCVVFILLGGGTAIAILWEGNWSTWVVPVGCVASLIILPAIFVGFYKWLNK